LLRFGFELIEKLCHFFGITIHIINKQNDVSFEQELSQDIIMLMTVFSARYYGKRSHKNKIKVSETA
jgi:predicted site-specific integrase-resolvase